MDQQHWWTGLLLNLYNHFKSLFLAKIIMPYIMIHDFPCVGRMVELWFFLTLGIRSTKIGTDQPKVWNYGCGATQPSPNTPIDSQQVDKPQRHSLLAVETHRKLLGVVPQKRLGILRQVKKVDFLKEKPYEPCTKQVDYLPCCWFCLQNGFLDLWDSLLWWGVQTCFEDGLVDFQVKPY